VSYFLLLERLLNLIHVVTCTAIATVVTIAEILKNNGLAVEKSEISILFLFFSLTFLADVVESLITYYVLCVCSEIMTSTVDMREETGGRPVPKAKVNHQYNLLLDHLSDMLLGIQ
jgi:hypothetical protein